MSPFVRFALLTTAAVAYAVVEMPFPTLSRSSHAPVTSSTPDHASFSALHSALLGSSLLPSPFAFSEHAREKSELDWLTGWLTERFETTRLLVEIAKRINDIGRVKGVDGTEKEGKI